MLTMNEKILTKKDKMNCDFIVRYGNNNSVNRGFFDTYDQVIKEYDSIKLNADITWKQIIWEPLDRPETQFVIKQDEVTVMEILNAKFVLKC